MAWCVGTKPAGTAPTAPSFDDPAIRDLNAKVLPRPTLVPLLVVTSSAASFTSTTALPDHVSL